MRKRSCGHAWSEENTNTQGRCRKCDRERAKKRYYAKKGTLTDSEKQSKAEYMKKYYAENKEKLADQKKGHYEKNREETKARSRKYSAENKQKIQRRNSEYRKANPEKMSERNRAYNEANRPRIQARNREYLAARPEKKRALHAKRRASKLQRTPPWLTALQRAEIEKHYLNARMLEDAGFGKHHVDHIVPLQGKKVSGLHVPWNLQVLRADDNMRKGNRLLP